jgi:hypothetical protein
MCALDSLGGSLTFHFRPGGRTGWEAQIESAVAGMPLNDLAIVTCGVRRPFGTSWYPSRTRTRSGRQ